jgi:hypothetical protein
MTDKTPSPVLFLIEATKMPNILFFIEASQFHHLSKQNHDRKKDELKIFVNS